jgi:Peptidase S24-like
LRLEAGKTKNPEPEVLRCLSDLYEVPIEELLARFWQARYGVSAGRVAAAGEAKPTSVPGFVAIPLLHRPIAAGEPLDTNPDPDIDEALAFGERFVRRFTRPVCLRVGKREESMLPLIQPGDVVAIDQAEETRSKPLGGHVYAVNFGPLSGENGGAVKRIELSDKHLIVLSDNPDKARYPTRVFDLEGRNLLEALKGEVVWVGKHLGSGKGK